MTRFLRLFAATMTVAALVPVTAAAAAEYRNPRSLGAGVRGYGQGRRRVHGY